MTRDGIKMLRPAGNGGFGATRRNAPEWRDRPNAGRPGAAREAGERRVEGAATGGFGGDPP